MNVLLKKIQDLMNSNIKDVVEARISQFKKLGHSDEDSIFKELCFCILTANYTAEGGIRIQNAVGEGFLRLNKESLAKLLKDLKHRFPNKRAEFIIEARGKKSEVYDNLRKTQSGKMREIEFRSWLAENIKGLGYKEASHFMRNIGFFNVAIIDFHIVDILVRNKFISRPKTLTKSRYYDIESVLSKIARTLKIDLARLDLYLWYLETGKILK